MLRRIEKRENTNNPNRYQEFGLTQTSDKTWSREVNGKTETLEIVDWSNNGTLKELVDLQMRVWGMPEKDAVPDNVLAIAGDTGGSVIVARNSEGKIEGFVLTMGVTDGTLFLHMIGVDPESRYKKDLGWNLSVLQLLTAQEKGVEKIVWTYDPMRGSNARLNLEKLGAIVQKYTINKYGKQDNQLYGESPTDRFTAEWNISDPRVLDRLRNIQSGDYQPKALQDVSHLKILEGAITDPKSAPDEFLVEIPYDIDLLPEEEKIKWRKKLRKILTSTLFLISPKLVLKANLIGKLI